jgi:hypothetical protein
MVGKSNADMKKLKDAAEAEFGDIDGVEGLGIGNQTLRVYVRSHDVKNFIPSIFHTVPVQIIVTGTIMALTEAVSKPPPSDIPEEP